jgi:hypothetical protein
MASIISTKTSGGGGIAVTGDTSGVMELASANGTTAVTIDASQNVGIGTASPTAKIDIVSSSSSVARFAYSTVVSTIVNSTGSGTSYFGDATSANAWGINSGSNFVSAWTNNTERMRIDSSGNVGIGTSSPVTQLDISATSNPRIRFEDVGDFEWRMGIVDSSRFGFFSGGSVTERMRITDAGEVWIAGTTDRGAFNLQCNGTGVWGAGAYTNGSDARIKEEIEPISSSLEVVNKLNPVTFKYKEDWSSDRATQTGFIAQELQEALADEVYIDGVVNDTSEYMSVAYQNIIPILTKAIQEQQAIIQELKARIEVLEGASA